MVSTEMIRNRLDELHFNVHGWGRTEAGELPNIIMPDEEIYDLVNGVYEGGFALLVATNVRILLIDKKPLNYLTVEDLRFDMISEIDYNHRVIGANINVSTGSKNLRFMSLNKQRLRKLITHVQHCMAALKKQANEHREDQKLHLEQISQQLQTYLSEQNQQNHRLRDVLDHQNRAVIDVEPVQSPNRLADYLYAQSLLNQHPETKEQADVESLEMARNALREGQQAPPQESAQQQISNELLAEGTKEVFGTGLQSPAEPRVMGFEVHPLRVAYAKLPQILQNRFNRSAEGSAERLPAQQPVATR